MCHSGAIPSLRPRLCFDNVKLDFSFFTPGSFFYTADLMLFASQAYMVEQIRLQIFLSHLHMNLRYTKENKIHIFTITPGQMYNLAFQNCIQSKNNITGRGVESLSSVGSKVLQKICPG